MPLTQIFNGYIETPALDIDEERQLIHDAQNGHEPAYEKLLKTYAPVLKKYVRSTPTDLKEDVESALLLGFVEAINDFDPEKHSSLSYIITNYLKRSLSTIGATSQYFTIPQRTLSRWLSIYKKADYNYYEGIALAPMFQMSSKTYIDIHTALKSTDSLDALLVGGTFLERSIHIETQDPVGEDDEDLVRIVFSTKGDENDLSQREADVLRHAYGFLSYGDPLSDDAVGDAVGCSRPTAQRLRSGALRKAADRLGVSK